MIYDKPYKTIDELVELLETKHGLKIENKEIAKNILTFTPYYDLVNGYKECFMSADDKFLDSTTFDSLYMFHVFNRGFQNNLFEFSIVVENYFKNVLGKVISQNIGISQEDYLNPQNYIKGEGRITRGKILNKIQCTCLHTLDNPTAFYREHHNHIPPWIFLKNISFSVSINLFRLLKREAKKEVLDILLPIPFSEDQKYPLLLYILTLTRKLRNIIAHNLKFTTFDCRKYGHNLNKKAIRSLVPENLLSDNELKTEYGMYSIYGYIYFTLSIMPASFMKIRLCNGIANYLTLFSMHSMQGNSDPGQWWLDIGKDYLEHLHLPVNLGERMINETERVLEILAKDWKLSDDNRMLEGERIQQEDLAFICKAKYIIWDELKNKTLLVTGATGLIGSTLVKSLLYANVQKKLGLHILALVRNWEKAEKMLGQENDSLEFILGSVENLPGISQPVDYIIHGASPTASLFFVQHPVETIQIAVKGTANLLNLAKGKKAKGFVYLSSMEVYGAPQEDKKIPETQGCTLDSMVVRSCYPIAKRLCENLCASYAAEYGVPAKVIRLAQTFGPGVLKSDQRVFAEFARDAMNGENIILQTSGTSKRAYLYTADAASAILTVLLNGQPGNAYNAASPETYCSIVEMAQLVAHEIAADKIKVQVPENVTENDSRFPPPHHLNLDVTKLEKLGWRPEKGLKEMYLRMMAGMGE